MHEEIDYNALSWVRPELDEVLKQACSLLGEHAENRENRNSLQDCAKNLQQVRGPLCMIGLKGADRLASEMEEVIADLLQGAEAQTGPVPEALIDAFLQLPDYLSRLNPGRSDNPAVLLPVINSLREVRGVTALEAFAVFDPVLEVSLPAEIFTARMSVPDEKIQARARAARSRFQPALLEWYRGNEGISGVQTLHDVLIQLLQDAGRDSVARLWWAAACVAEAILAGDILETPECKQMFGRVDRQIKRLVDVGESAFEDPLSDELMKRLLYCIATTESSLQCMQSIRTTYKLPAGDARKIIADESLAGFSEELLQKVSLRAAENIVSIKENLDLFLRANQRDLESLSPLADDLHSLGNVLDMIGIDRFVDDVVKQEQLVRGMAAGETVIDETTLMNVANLLVAVESAVHSLGGRDSIPKNSDADSLFLEQGRQALVREAVSDVALLKEAVTRFINSPDNFELLASVPGLLSGIHGSLQNSGQKRAAVVVGQIENFVKVELLEQHQPLSKSQLDLVADAVCSVEYFIEQSAGDHAQGDWVLGVAEKGLAKLGYGCADIPVDEQQTIYEESDAPLQQDTVESRVFADPPPEQSTDSIDAPVITDLQVIDSAADEEILAIFIEEADEVLAQLGKQLPAWLATPSDSEGLIEMRRGFHTIKGSGRMVGALAIAEFAWVFEGMLNRVIEASLEPGEELLDLLGQSLPAMTQLLAQVKETDAVLQADVNAIARKVVMLRQPGVPCIESPLELSAETLDDKVTPVEICVEELVTEDLPEDDQQQLEDYIKECSELSAEDPISAMDSDHPAEEPVSAMGSEHPAEDLLSAIDSELPTEDPAAAIDGELPTEDPAAAIDSELPTEDPVPVIDSERPAEDPYAALDSELLEVFIEEAAEIIDAGEITLRAWSKQPASQEFMTDFQRQLHTLKGGARMVDIKPIGDLSHTLETLLTRVVEGQVEANADLFVLLQDSHDHLAEMVEHVKAHELPVDACALQSVLDEHGLEAAVASPEELLTLPVEDEPGTSVGEDNDDPGVEVIAGLDALEQMQFEPVPNVEDETTPSIQPEMERFIESGVEVTPESEAEPAPEPEAEPVIEVASEFATEPVAAPLIETVAGPAPEPEAVPVIEAVAGSVVEAEEKRTAGAEVEPVIEAGPGLKIKPETEPAIEAAKESTVVSDVEPVTQMEPVLEKPPEIASNTDAHEPRLELLPPVVERRKNPRVHKEQIRVRADMLDDMVNHAAEINIYRARMEQQICDYRYHLAELDQTIGRLREQLRQVEIETETHILFRYEQEGESAGQDFDPLEMDRYSNLQQLSRSLIESIGDLRSLQGLMENTTRESEALFLQQSRVSTDLQEGLLRSRMIPFSGLAPRLRRILRQSAKELGKEVNLNLEGADGEMDRTVIDRIIAPLEHMLRNAVAHGIEDPALRKQLGKSPAGSVSISFEREGSEIVLRIEDDGAGLDIDAIRSRAIERKLLDANDNLPDSDIMQFVLHTGFSTATEVTQLAGRGVGMDVVNGEVKQLGGSLHITSTAGSGTTFTVRLPYTLAINQVLLVVAGEETFCVPLGSIEGIARMFPHELADCYKAEENILEYADNRYQLQHLGSLLGCGGLQQGMKQSQVPVLLARLGEKRIAFQLESILGRREIVIKPLGAQLRSVNGISGATILGDGHVVLILDIMSLSRMQGQAAAPDMTVSSRGAERLHVMVVDDSITVRKVTSRLLERNGFKVLTAKDGVDALGQLRENVPDLMLLDIEMPRMDGFELATHMRNDARLKHVPIIMITSRTGDKHRKHAQQIGVNGYLGKPYQEHELLDSIQSLINIDSKEECA